MPTVCEVFLSMDSKDKIVCNREGKEWLSKYEALTDSCGRHVYVENEFKMDSSEWKQILRNAVSLFNKNSNLFTQILNEVLFNNPKDAEEIVNVFLKDYLYYLEVACDTVFGAHEEKCVYLYISFEDIYILGRILTPFLIAGYTVKIKPLHKSLYPYLVAVGDLFCDAGFTKGTKYLLMEFEEAEDPNRFFFRHGRSPQFCPMVIFEESDLDSAVACLAESCNRFNGMLYWSLTHVYVQESIFNDVISKLKDISQRVLPDSEFVSCDQRNQLKEHEPSSLKFFLNWDPRELEINCDLKMSICLLPFRSMDEAVSLINSQGSSCAASVWTDKLTIANSFTKLLKLSTIWVNSHGDVDPSVPLDSFNVTQLPLNGIQLLDHLSLIITAPGTLIKCKSPTVALVPSIIPIRKSLEEAVKFSSSGCEYLKKLDNKCLQNILDDLFTYYKKLDNSVSQYKVPFNSDNMYHPNTKMDVLCHSVSSQIVLLIISADSIDVNQFYQVLVHLITSRNALIICATYEIVNMMLQTSLVEFITFIDLKHFNFDNKYVCKIGKIIYYEDLVNWNKTVNTVQCINPSIFSFKKSVWWPTK